MRANHWYWGQIIVVKTAAEAGRTWVELDNGQQETVETTELDLIDQPTAANHWYYGDVKVMWDGVLAGKTAVLAGGKMVEVDTTDLAY